MTVTITPWVPPKQFILFCGFIFYWTDNHQKISEDDTHLIKTRGYNSQNVVIINEIE